MGEGSPLFILMKKDEPIYVKCDNCGEMFVASRNELDQHKNIVSITSQFSIPIELPHPVLKNVDCHYFIRAAKGDYCNGCCLEFLKIGLIALKQQFECENL